MSHITLIRHGQANTHARDEEEYDRLSTLGHQQSGWLGEHLRQSASHHTRLYTGTLLRHRETAASMALETDLIEDARLNELEYFNLARLMEEQHGLPFPTEREDFVAHLPQIFTAWKAGKLEGTAETFADFETRVAEALHDIAIGDGPALVVTSGGVIAIALRRMMELNIASTARIALAIMNTSMHRLFPIGAQLSPVLFNAVPHLDIPDRHFAQTHF
ncbi:histidine phosphatase family protein [Pontibaca salina]|uniref:Histidine phosphatase family protein n=1 Tax=Pontibaca salina TaxID=2795731 RepID=A0A934HMG7_9RHOB|nr:histidine phosphatase family protein [Pontibaca salina]MBI6630934.1 histidine phosphatase family protein [Pontibaca salina]